MAGSFKCNILINLTNVTKHTQLFPCSFSKSGQFLYFPGGKMLMCDIDRERKGRKERKIKGYFQK